MKSITRIHSITILCCIIGFLASASVGLAQTRPGPSIPDGGTTIFLLSGAIAGLAMLRRRFMK